MPVRMLPPPAPDTRMADLNALIGSEQSTLKRWTPRTKPVYLAALADELKARAAAILERRHQSAARAREAKRLKRVETEDGRITRLRAAAAHARQVRWDRVRRQEHEMVMAALAREVPNV